MSNDFIECLAPAKINLFLHVTGRRADGYHCLQTAFRMLDHGDRVALRVRDDGSILRLNEVAGVPAEQDLAIRAARLLQQKTGCRLGAEIRVDKRLPMGGGLGGGSSDAATVMLALNRLWQLDVPRQTLQDWALSLGADVPFFIYGRTAMATGVGEQLQPLSLPPAWYVVVEPGVHVPTPEIFRDKGLTRDSEMIIISGFPALDIIKRFENDARNDLESVACRLYPQVAQAVQVLQQFGAARMSGSGACVFVSLDGPDRARQVVEEVKEFIAAQNSAWRVWSAAALDVHPLHDWAAA